MESLPTVSVAIWLAPTTVVIVFVALLVAYQEIKVSQIK